MDLKLTASKFEHGLKSIGITEPVMVDQFFHAFDHDKDGLIDFRDFTLISLVSVSVQGFVYVEASLIS